MKIVIEVNDQTGLTIWGNISPATTQVLIDLMTILLGLVQLLEIFQRLSGM